MKKEHRSESFGVVWLIILLMALANTFTAFAQVNQATLLVNGMSCDLEQVILKV